MGPLSLSFQFPSWKFRSLQSCRALTRLTKEGLLAVYNSELKQESADVRDVMNSNRKFDVSLINGNLDLSHTVNLNAFLSTPAVRSCTKLSKSTEREAISTSGCHFDVRDVNVHVA